MRTSPGVAETEAQKQTYPLVIRGSTPRKRMTEQEIRATVGKLADIIRVLSEADADDKSEIFRQLGLKPTYQPSRRIVEARIEPASRGFSKLSEGGT